MILPRISDWTFSSREIYDIFRYAITAGNKIRLLDSCQSRLAFASVLLVSFCLSGHAIFFFQSDRWMRKIVIKSENPSGLPCNIVTCDQAQLTTDFDGYKKVENSRKTVACVRPAHRLGNLFQNRSDLYSLLL